MTFRVNRADFCFSLLENMDVRQKGVFLGQNKLGFAVFMSPVETSTKKTHVKPISW